MEERLQQIEKAFGRGRMEIEDINWLIGQAKEKIELEKELDLTKQKYEALLKAT
ncbi:hypothetical protein ACFRCQ_21830 [Cytobacillus firmus]|uniref:hypothetical protein n=1 Tax=Cytobacillus firmus TaxID=1399 RepID=UPI00368CB23B